MPYLRESGDEVKDCQTQATEEAMIEAEEEEVEVPTELTALVKKPMGIK